VLKPFTFIVVVGLVALGAMVNGAATQRWSTFEPDMVRTDALHAFEVRFQDWTSEPVPTDMPTNERSTATSRRYRSPQHAAVITFISGIPGSVAAHTPDICYPGSGYKTIRAPKKEAVELPNGTTAMMYVADFEKKTATKHDRARVRWTWAADGGWVAPDQPRWQFATQLTRVPVLYKLYIVTSLPDESEERPEDDPVTREFVSATLSQYGAAAK
jgi:hypothetical protein